MEGAVSGHKESLSIRKSSTSVALKDIVLAHYMCGDCSSTYSNEMLAAEIPVGVTVASVFLVSRMRMTGLVQCNWAYAGDRLSIYRYRGGIGLVSYVPSEAGGALRSAFNDFPYTFFVKPLPQYLSILPQFLCRRSDSPAGRFERCVENLEGACPVHANKLERDRYSSPPLVEFVRQSEGA